MNSEPLAWAVLSEMIGAVILARVTNSALADELIGTVVADLLARRDEACSKTASPKHARNLKKAQRTGRN